MIDGAIRDSFRYSQKRDVESKDGWADIKRYNIAWNPEKTSSFS